MANLFDSLTTASRSLAAQRMGLDVAGQNLANVNTVGYTRRTLVLQEVPPESFNSAGRGVEVLRMQSLRDNYLEGRIRREQSTSSFGDAVVETLSSIEAGIGLPGQALDERLSAFFDAFATFADDPTSMPARDGVVQQGRLLADSFNDMSERLTAAQHDADIRLSGTVDKINALAAQVADLNARIANQGGDVENLRDQRNVAMAELAKLADVTVTENDDGTTSVTVGHGRPIVVSGHSYQMTLAPGAPSGFSAVFVAGSDVTAEIGGGTVGGLLHARDNLIPAYQTRLDQLAYDVATAVNTEHVAGFDANGAAAGNFFAAPAGPTGAAGALQVTAAILADSRLVAGSATGAPGDNGVARSIAALRDARLAAGGTTTAADAWGQYAYRVGADMAEARSTVTSRDQVILQLQRLRDQVSGVSVDEEAANLMKFQRAYEATARYFTTISDTLDILMQMVH